MKAFIQHLVHHCVHSLQGGFTFLRFSSLSIASAVLDYLVFVACFWFLQDVLSSIVIARVISCTMNFLGAKHFTFKASEAILPQIVKYIMLAVFLVLMGYVIVTGLNTLFGLSIYLAKVIAEVLLFPTSFFIQRIFVFAEKKTIKL